MKCSQKRSDLKFISEQHANTNYQIKYCSWETAKQKNEYDDEENSRLVIVFSLVAGILQKDCRAVGQVPVDNVHVKAEG